MFTISKVTVGYAEPTDVEFPDLEVFKDLKSDEEQTVHGIIDGTLLVARFWRSTSFRTAMLHPVLRSELGHKSDDVNWEALSKSDRDFADRVRKLKLPPIMRPVTDSDR